MNTIKNVSLLLLILAISACSTTKNKISNNVSSNYEQYGEKIEPNGYISFNDMMTQLNQKGTYTGKVKGTVQSVCQKKGCWMTLNNGEGGEELFIKFKDYGFFMPFDLSGKQVVIRGNAQKETTSVDMLKHYAMDAGESKETIDKITEPETAFNFMADGVVVIK